MDYCWNPFIIKLFLKPFPSWKDQKGEQTTNDFGTGLGTWPLLEPENRTCNRTKEQDLYCARNQELGLGPGNNTLDFHQGKKLKTRKRNLITGTYLAHLVIGWDISQKINACLSKVEVLVWQRALRSIGQRLAKVILRLSFTIRLTSIISKE